LQGGAQIVRALSIRPAGAREVILGVRRPDAGPAMTTRRAPILAAAALAVTASLLAFGPTATASAACTAADRPAHQITSKQGRKATLCLINKQRAKHGMPKLKARFALRKAAKRHTRRMLKKRCYSHRCPGEPDLVGRISGTSYLPCNCAWGVGENIAYGFERRSSPRAIVKAWMKSAPHRANILNRSFEHIGVGVKPGAPVGGSRAATYTTTFGYLR
jgi:uncharacterized protein YkwD